MAQAALVPSASLEGAQLESWRAATRQGLVARRIAAPAPLHARWRAAIEAHLESELAGQADGVVGFCWPYRAEFDARPAVLRLLARGARAALPVVVSPREPLAFRLWSPDCAMDDGAYVIPVPRDGAIVKPDVILLPANGFDARGYRLGYGGGYFDRTLALLSPRPRVIGVAFELGRLETIHPQAHDVPLDCVVTEAGVQRCEPGALAPALAQTHP
jgi:5-formyltetrahydrofolate cyclo-ligase